MVQALPESFIEPEWQFNRHALHQLSAQAEAAWVLAARTNPSLFNEYVLRNEETGEPITQAPMHDEWHDLLSAAKRVIIWSHIEGGKTQQISIGRTLFEIGQDTTLRCVLLANTTAQASKLVSSVANYIRNSPEYRKVFPHVVPATPWTTTALKVRRRTIAKDFTLQGIGVGGKVVGARIDRLFGDDILDFENTRTSDNRAETIAWFHKELVGRFTRRSLIWIVGNAYYPDDLLHYLARFSKYVARVYPIIDRNTGVARFPEAWPPERIQSKREELGPIEAARQLDCKTRSKDSSRCPDEWILRNLKEGEGFSVKPRLPRAHRELPDRIVVTGVDLGIGAKKKDGKTSLASVRYWLRGPHVGKRDLLNLKSGHWNAPVILREIEIAQEAYGGIVAVESNATQRFVVQIAQIGLVAALAGVDVATLAEGQPLPEEIEARILRELSVRGVNTGTNKWHPVYGIEGLFLEFSKGMWAWPSPDGTNPQTQEIADLCGQCTAFSPDAHTGDELMSLWLSREGFRKYAEDFRTMTSADAGDVGTTILGAPPTLADLPEDRREILTGWEAVLKR